MSKSDSREGAPEGQAKSKDDMRVQLREGCEPLRKIDPSDIYFADELANKFRTTIEAVNSWKSKGCKRVDREDVGLKHHLYFGDVLLEFLRSHLK